MSDNRLRNSLEPLALVQAFQQHPPFGFQVKVTPDQLLCFVTRFDLLTTATPLLRRFLAPIHSLLPKLQTVFVGSTVSEYTPLSNSLTTEQIVASARNQGRIENASLTIIKDLPNRSPLLTKDDNAFAADLLQALAANDFILVDGEALAYVPIDFATVNEFIQRFSRARRKDYRRKLKARTDLQIECRPTGDGFASDELCQQIYRLYENVFHASTIHFDQLSEAFFRSVLRAAELEGRVFLYSQNGQLIAFNLCFEHGDKLIDKYIGFDYPTALACNLYFVSWFHNLEYCLKNGLKTFVAGWTDPEVKRDLGAKFTFTTHAVHIHSPFLRTILKRLRPLFESDRAALAESIPENIK